MEPVNRSLRAYIWRRAATQGRTSAQFSPYSQAPLGHKARAACQFRARGFMKGWLTVNVPVVSRQGLGTSAAMSPDVSPGKRDRGRTRVSIHSGPFARF
jgi:hypothetical protein